MSQPQNILVIKLGALGDLLLSMKPFQDIRMAYPLAQITLLTMPAFAGFARQMPWFNKVIEDTRPEWWQWRAWRDLRNSLLEPQFDTVIDFQNKPRTRFYKTAFFGNRVQWSSSTGNSTYPRTVFTHKMHRQEELLVQLRQAGIEDSGPLRLLWMEGPIQDLKLPERYVVLVPGCSAHLLHKRWPPAAYAELARGFYDQGVQVVVVGTKADAESIAAIKANASFVIDLAGRTTFAQLASLYRNAVAVIGNDTGPTFLAAMVGAPTLTLMSHHTDPVRSGPVGPKCAWLKEEIIADISVECVQRKLAELI